MAPTTNSSRDNIKLPATFTIEDDEEEALFAWGVCALKEEQENNGSSDTMNNKSVAFTQKNFNDQVNPSPNDQFRRNVANVHA